MTNGSEGRSDVHPQTTAEQQQVDLLAVAPWCALFFLFATWELLAFLANVPEFVLPRPSRILQAAWVWRDPLLSNAMQTLYSSLLGFFMAVGIGLVFGVVVGASKSAYHILYPLLVGFNSIPKIALVPVLVLWFGIGTVPAVITAFLIAFFPIAVNVATGIATTEPELRDVLRALGARPLDVLIKVSLPRSMPYFFASLKVAISMALVGSIMSETVASNSGIGHLMIVASSKFDVPLVFAGLLASALLGVGMYMVANIFERRMCGWAVHRVEAPTRWPCAPRRAWSAPTPSS